MTPAIPYNNLSKVFTYNRKIIRPYESYRPIIPFRKKKKNVDEILLTYGTVWNIIARDYGKKRNDVKYNRWLTLWRRQDRDARFNKDSIRNKRNNGKKRKEKESTTDRCIIVETCIKINNFFIRRRGDKNHGGIRAVLFTCFPGGGDAVPTRSPRARSKNVSVRALYVATLHRSIFCLWIAQRLQRYGGMAGVNARTGTFTHTPQRLVRSRDRKTAAVYLFIFFVFQQQHISPPPFVHLLLRVDLDTSVALVRRQYTGDGVTDDRNGDSSLRWRTTRKKRKKKRNGRVGDEKREHDSGADGTEITTKRQGAIQYDNK